MRVHSARKRAGMSSIPPVDADAPNVVWAIDFQFDSTVDNKAIKIASVIDEHTRCSPLHLVERSITAERLVVELESVFATAGGPPKVLRMDNGPELVSRALQRFCEGRVGLSYIAPGTPWNNGLHRIVLQPASEGVPQPQPLEHFIRGPRRDRRLQTRTQPPSLGPWLLNAGRVRCGGLRAHPYPGRLRDQPNPENNPTLKPGGLSNGVSPVTPCGQRPRNATGKPAGPGADGWPSARPSRRSAAAANAARLSSVSNRPAVTSANNRSAVPTPPDS